MQEGEHHLRLEIAKVLDSRGSHVSRELARNSPREIEVVQDGRFYQIAVNDHGEFTIAEPPPKRVLGKILLGLGCFAVLGAAALFVADYISLKTARPSPMVLTAIAPGPVPVVLGSTQSKKTVLIAPLPPTYAAPKPTLDLASEPLVATQKSGPPPAAAPSPANHQIPLSHGFGEVKADDGSTKFLIKPPGSE